MAFVEIYPNNKSGMKFSDEHFKWHENYNSCMEWFVEGNEIVVVLNTETNAKAVYERIGNVLCLDDRFNLYRNVDFDDGWMHHNEIIRRMLVNEALVAGFPKKCPCPKEEPKKKFLVDLSMYVSTSAFIEANDINDAMSKAKKAKSNPAFFDSIFDDIDFRCETAKEEMFATLAVDHVQEDNVPDVEPIDVDSFI